MQWFREELGVTHHLHRFGFTGLTITNPKMQFICFAQFPNFAEIHRTKQSSSHPRDTERFFFFCLKKETQNCFLCLHRRTKPHSTLNSPGTGWASGASFGAPAADRGHSSCGDCRVGTHSQEGPGSHCCFQYQTHCTLPGSLVKSRHGATEKNKHDFAF